MGVKYVLNLIKQDKTTQTNSTYNGLAYWKVLAGFELFWVWFFIVKLTYCKFFWIEASAKWIEM